MQEREYSSGEPPRIDATLARVSVIAFLSFTIFATIVVMFTTLSMLRIAAIVIAAIYLLAALRMTLLIGTGTSRDVMIEQIRHDYAYHDARRITIIDAPPAGGVQAPRLLAAETPAIQVGAHGHFVPPDPPGLYARAVAWVSGLYEDGRLHPRRVLPATSNAPGQVQVRYPDPDVEDYLTRRNMVYRRNDLLFYDLSLSSPGEALARL